MTPDVVTPFRRSSYSGPENNCIEVALTAEGGLRTCLFSLQETPLRDLLRSGASDDHLGRVIEAAVWHKEEGHLINKPGFIKPAKNMSQIGG